MLPLRNNRTLLQQQQQRKRKESQQPLYLPAVYRYTCRGVFSASSQERGSAGHCQGIRSAIEHIIDMDPMTREEALKHFVTGGDDSMAGASGDDDANVAGALAIEDGRTNPALIYPPPPPPPANKNSNDKNPSSKNFNDEEVVVAEPVAASDVINGDAVGNSNSSKIEHESWSAFGSTEVECLQLTDLDNGSTEIVALAPYNAALVSKRKIVMDDRRITSTEIGIGPYKMQFLVETIHVAADHDDVETSHATSKRSESSSSVAVPDSSSIFPIAIPSNILTIESARHCLEQGREFSGRVYDFSLKMVDQMYFQTDWLKKNLQDDFLARTVASGHRIIAEMPRTVSIFGKAFRSLFGSDNNDDDHHDD